MARKVSKPVRFPFKGLARNLSFQLHSEQGYTCYDAENVRPDSTLSGRTRGGVRPGLVRTHKAPSANRVRLLEYVNAKTGDEKFAFWQDTFNYAAMSSSTWAVLSGLTSALPSITGGYAYGSKGDATEQKSAVLTAATLTGFDSVSANGYRVGIYITPYSNAHHGVYSLFLRLDDTSPTLGDSIECQLTITGAGTLSYDIRKDNASLTTGTPTAETVATEGWFEASLVKGVTNDTITLYWRGNQIATTASSTGTATAHARVGFGCKATTTGGQVQVQRFRIEYYKSTAVELLRPRLIMSLNGTLYRENPWWGHWAATAATRTLASDRQLQGADRGQKLYIADCSESIASGTDGVIASNGTFTSATYSNWTTSVIEGSTGRSKDDYVVVVTTTGICAGVYVISAVSGGNITLSGYAANGTALTFRIERAPKIYDPKTDTLTVWAADEHTTGTLTIVDGVATVSTGTLPTWIVGRTLEISGTTYVIASRDSATQFTITDLSIDVGAGTAYRIGKGRMPAGCTMVARYRDRLVLAGDPLDPNEYYMTAMGDPLDMDFTQNNTGAAVKGANSEAGRVGDPITALMSYNDDHMFFGCRSSLWVMRGDPTGGGRVDLVSSTIGVLSPNSWTNGPKGECVWLGRDGIYKTNPTCLTCEPISVSRDVLPRELIDLNPDLCTVSAAYEVRDRGYIIGITPKDVAAGTRHWFLDDETGGFFPITYATTDYYPTCMKYVPMPEAEDSCVLMGCVDGAIRRFSWTAGNDDQQTLSSYVTIGPMALGGGDFDNGQVEQITVDMAENSGNVTWSVWTAATPELAATGTPVNPATGTFTSGGQKVIYPMRSGRAWCLKLTGTTGYRWAADSMAAILRLLGKAKF